MLPRHWDRRTTVLLAFALLSLINAKSARAQVVDFQSERAPVVEIHDLWRFHTGDDPDGKLGWSNPKFDDSHWPLIRSDQPWDGQGYPGYRGMAWYRFQVVLPAHHSPLALFIPVIYGNYQVFAGGRLVGQLGGMPPEDRLAFSFTVGSQKLIPLPSDLTSTAGPLSIAIRIWINPQTPTNALGAGPQAAIRIGDAALLGEWKTLQIRSGFWSLFATNILLLVYLIAGGAGLGLFLLRPTEREYLWFAAIELANAAFGALWIYEAFHAVDLRVFWALSDCLQAASSVCFLFFLVALLKQRRSLIYWIALTSAVVAPLPALISIGSVDVALITSATVTLTKLPYEVCVLVFLFFAARRGSLDARLLLGPVGLSFGLGVVERLLWAAHFAGYTALEAFRQQIDQTFTWPFPGSSQNVADFLMQLSILAILVLRFARTRRDEERMSSELEAARAVQQVLIPEEIPAIPGLAIECVYKPAGQVGGDFFQILPVASPDVTHIASPDVARIASPEGAGAFRPLNPAAHQEGFSPGQSDRTSALIVIGDVSGKGMPAAMAVSLLVGTVRTLAHYTLSPAEILNAMNLRMLGRSKNGFTTCLVLRLDPNGTATVANAGHLAPYLGSHEVPVESGLPLGLAAQADYTESTFHLDPDAELTLVTDGIAEARSKTGELFGFDRTAAISTDSAANIAKAAELFGQEDDITVLKIRRQPAPVGTETLVGD
jgi:serine phosphatase RsbU (regulator of sigma subunit)